MSQAHNINVEKLVVVCDIVTRGHRVNVSSLPNFIILFNQNYTWQKSY